MSTNGYQFDPISAIFPMMADDELQALADDIRENGLRQPVWLFEGKVLDGRNRLAACRIAGKAPHFETFTGSRLEALKFAWSMNRPRRHLNKSQAAIAESKRAQLDDQYRASLERERAEAAKRKGGDRRSESARQQKNSGGNSSPTDREANKVRTQRAEEAGTNPRYVSDADRIVRDRPDLAEKIADGKLTIPQAKREIQREEKRRELEQKAQAAKPENGKARTWQIINGDCLAELAKIKSGSARLIFADPPYNIGVDYGPGEKADKLPAGKYLDWCGRWMRACVEALTDDGSLWVMINDEWADHFGMLLREAGLTRRAWVKWYETFGVNQANNFNRCSRHIFYCVRDPKRFVFHAEAVNRPSDRQVKYGDKRADPAGKIWDDVWMIPRLVGTAAERIPDFPTQVPLAITRAIVGCASDPGDLVIDPFNGSGSTGVACIETGRRYIGIEKEKRFCLLSSQRLAGM